VPLASHPAPHLHMLLLYRASAACTHSCSWSSAVRALQCSPCAPHLLTRACRSRACSTSEFLHCHQRPRAYAAPAPTTSPASWPCSACRCLSQRAPAACTPLLGSPAPLSAYCGCRSAPRRAALRTRCASAPCARSLRAPASGPHTASRAARRELQPPAHAPELCSARPAPVLLPRPAARARVRSAHLLHAPGRAAVARQPPRRPAPRTGAAVCHCAEPEDEAREWLGKR
jgi:hypothetical protein